MRFLAETHVTIDVEGSVPRYYWPTPATGRIVDSPVAATIGLVPGGTACQMAQQSAHAEGTFPPGEYVVRLEHEIRADSYVTGPEVKFAFSFSETPDFGEYWFHFTDPTPRPSWWMALVDKNQNGKPRPFTPPFQFRIP